MAFVLIIINLSVFAQINTSTADAETYSLYLKKDWENLIDKGKEALKNDIDFYYLRYRLGLAYYYTDKYRKAITHFEKALNFNDSDDNLKLKLYYSYLYSGRENDAVFIASAINDSIKNHYDIENKFINSFSFCNTFSNISEKEISTDEYIESNIDSLDQGVQHINEDFTVLNICAEHFFAKRFKIRHSFNRIAKNNYSYNRDFTGVIENRSLLTKQNQYYLKLDFLARKGLKIHGGFHFLNMKFNKDTVILAPPFRRNKYQETIIENGLAYFAGITGNIDNFMISYNYSFLDFLDEKQSQHDISFVYYPLGNKNLYSVSIFSILQNDSLKSDFDLSESVFYQKFGFTIKQKLWIEFYGLFGSIKNYNIDNSEVIFTNDNIIRNNFGSNIIIPVNKLNLYLTLTYNYTKYNSYFMEFNKGFLDNPVEFHHHLIKGGIKWNF